jgi:hypothetical protein
MNRRQFVASSASLGLAATFALPVSLKATPTSAHLQTLEVVLTDTSFEIPLSLPSGRFLVNVSNTGTLAASHFALGQIPDTVTDAQYEEWLTAIASGQDETDYLSFEAINFVGVPDWPSPGATVSGIIDLLPGRYFLFDPFSGREALTLHVYGGPVDAYEPDADVTVELREMEIILPQEACTSKPMRWKIENTGAFSHEVAVIPVPYNFTEEHLQLLFTLPEDATPPPGTPEFEYQPVAAIGILAGLHTSWLDVHLAPGRYLAACMVPFSTGYPHAMDGMYVIFDVA